MTPKVAVEAVSDKMLIETGETVQVLTLRRRDGVTFDVPLKLEEAQIDQLLSYLYDIQIASSSPAPTSPTAAPAPTSGVTKQQQPELRPYVAPPAPQAAAPLPYEVPDPYAPRNMPPPQTLAPKFPEFTPAPEDADGNFTGDGDVESF